MQTEPRNVAADLTDYAAGERDTVYDVLRRLEDCFYAYKEHCDTEALLDGFGEALISIGTVTESSVLMRQMVGHARFAEVCERAEEAHSRALRDYLYWQVWTQAHNSLTPPADRAAQVATEARLRAAVLAAD